MIGKYHPSFTLVDLVRAASSTSGGCSRLGSRLAAVHAVRHVFLFRSAREAIQAVLRALGYTGSAVVPAYNCIAVPEAVQAAGWRPVFADVAAGDVNMDCASLAAAIEPDTKVVVLTHQFGIPPDVDDQLDLCRRRRLFVLEDAAAALGARYKGRLAGTFGDVAVVSFHLTKIVNAGRAGAAMTNNDELAARIEALCNQAPGRLSSLRDLFTALVWWCATRPLAYTVLRRLWQALWRDRLHQVVRPDPRPRPNRFPMCSGFAASLAELQLRNLNANVAARERLAQIYSAALSGRPGIRTCPAPAGSTPSWMQFPVCVERKEECYQYLLRHGVDLSWTFRYCCGESYGTGGLEHSRRAAGELLGLPTYPGLKSQHARRASSVLLSFFERAE